MIDGRCLREGGREFQVDDPENGDWFCTGVNGGVVEASCLKHIPCGPGEE